MDLGLRETQLKSVLAVFKTWFEKTFNEEKNGYVNPKGTMMFQYLKAIALARKDGVTKEDLENLRTGTKG